MKEARVEIDWISFLLVAAMTTVALWAIVAADWAEGLTVIWVVALGGLAAGAALSVSRFRPWVAHCFSAVYSLGWGSYWLSRQVEGNTFSERLYEIDHRLGLWLWQVTHNEVSRDNLIFVILLAALAWWTSYLAVWYSQRFNRIWRVVLPSGLLLFANVYYAGSSLHLYLGLYLVVALLIISRSHILSQEQNWRQNLVGYTTDFRFDLLRAGFTVSLVAILVGWGVPAAASSQQAADLWNHMQGPWRSVEDTWSRIFSSLRSRQPVYADPFGHFLTLQGARTTTNSPVMDVKSTEPGYWRATVFNRYTGSGWVTTDAESVSVDNYNLLSYDTITDRHPVTQTFTILRPAISLIFADSQPWRVTLPVHMDAWTPLDTVLDPALISSGRTFAPGTGYLAISMVSNATTDQLRQAGQYYPAWVTDEYLQLPDTLPQRVRDLAQEITAPYDNLYDKATALELWMRANITYDDQIDPPPANRDVVDYLLFTSKRGYCDYYASGMAVMARAVGLPARVAVGYATGTYDSASGVYHVLDKDSHSWVEIYFPKYGWIVFEPTSSRTLVARPTPAPTPSLIDASGNPLTPSNVTRTPPRGRGELEDSNPIGSGNLTLRRGGAISPWLVGGIFGIGALLLIVAGVLTWSGFDSWSLHPVEVLLLAVSAPKLRERYTLAGLTSAQRAYARLMRLAGWLRVILTVHYTPHERGVLFSATVPEARQAISTIVDNYEREQYGRAAGSGADSRQAWESVRGWIWKAGVRMRKESVQSVLRQRVASFQRFTSRFS